MKILVLAPHPDDEVIGCGGTLASHVARGDDVTTVFLTSGELGIKRLAKEQVWEIREREAQSAAQVLGAPSLLFLRLPDWYLGDNIPTAVDALRPILLKERPQMIYLPHAQEWHPDHRAVSSILGAALAGSPVVEPEVRTYEVWTPLSEYFHVEEIGAFMEQKLKAVRCYTSQLVDFRFDRAVEGLNRYRGEIAARCDYAEVFGAWKP